MPDLSPALEFMRAVCDGHPPKRPTAFQQKLIDQFNDPKQFEKFMARLEKLEVEHLAAVKAAESGPRAEAEVEVDEGHAKVEALLAQLVAEFDLVREATRLAQAAQSRQTRPSASGA